MGSLARYGTAASKIVRLAAFRRRGVAIDDLVDAARVVPVARLPGAEYGAPLAKALLEGGLPIVELTWDPVASVSIVHAIRRVVPGMTIGVGVVSEPEDVEALSDAGISYVVGSTLACARAARACGLPFIAAVSDDEQVQGFAREGHRHCRILPSGDAAAGGGAMRTAHPGVHFQDYSDEPAQCAVRVTEAGRAGTACSWIAPRDLIAAGRFGEIARRARVARDIAHTTA